jgi:type IV pilus assembly protein PilP
VKRLGAVLFVGLLLVAGGCKNEASGPTTAAYEAAKTKVLAQPKEAPGAKPDAARPAEPPAAAATATAALAGQASSVRDYVYDPTGKKDPFRSFILEQARQKANEEVGPLEQFDISQLAVVAVVWDTHEPRALIADPSGRPYIVAEGAEVGKNDGKVIKIDDDIVVVKETYVDWLGEKTTKDIEMRLKSAGKGGKDR